MYIIWIVTCHFNIWLATCLSIFYCLKVANFSNSIFLYFKWRVKKVISVTLLVSLVVLLLYLLQSNTHMNVLIDEHKRNISYNSSLQNFPEFSKLVLLSNTMFTFIAFALSMTTFFLLIFSLWKHLKRVQHNVKGSRNPRTTAHIKAMQTVISFLLLYAVYLFCLIMQISGFKFLEKDHIIFFKHAVGIAVPSGHSLVLILGNRKLRQAFFSVVWWLRSRPKGMQSLGLKSISGRFGIFFRKNSS